MTQKSTAPPDTVSAEQQLRVMRSSLLEQIAQQRGGTIGRAEAAANRFGSPEDPRAQISSEKTLEFALGERELSELAEIDAALERLQKGHYGQCIDCAQAIAPARLAATPEAARCISCQEKFERLHA